MNPNIENILLTNKNYLICILDDIQIDNINEIEYIKTNFCGNVFNSLDELLTHSSSFDNTAIYYFCGNINSSQYFLDTNLSSNFYLIKDLSWYYDDYLTYFDQIITPGEVPINIHNVGVYFRNFFQPNKDYFNDISHEHQFQILTESNKISKSYRNGIYITPVDKVGDDIHFNLLRCSTNLEGPTDNFRDTDNYIIQKVNNISEHFFDKKTNLNHVLAQIYNNTSEGGSSKKSQRKAKIKAHSDKTKDMPKNALMAFCTFYQDFYDNQFNEQLIIKKSIADPYDYVYKNTSVLTKLRFRLKDDVNDDKYVKQFDITLYPNSVFIMGLMTNRIYTHEIVPSILDISKIPTRMGYVIRCSDTKAVFKNEQTYIIDDDTQLIKLEKPTLDDICYLRILYYKENTTTEHVDYGKIYFSMNDGDYTQPLI